MDTYVQSHSVEFSGGMASRKKILESREVPRSLAMLSDTEILRSAHLPPMTLSSGDGPQ